MIPRIALVVSAEFDGLFENVEVSFWAIGSDVSAIGSVYGVVGFLRL